MEIAVQLSGGTGQLVYYLDVMPPVVVGEPAVVGTESAASAQTSYTWRNVPPGIHQLWVQAVDSQGNVLPQPVITGAIVSLPEAS